VDLSGKLFKGQATVGLLLQYLWYSTPQFMNFVIPIATLVAVLGTIGGLTRSSELTVMRACGVSLYRAAVPLVVLALAWSVVLFALEERVMAPATRKAQALEDTIKGRPPRTMDVANSNWLAAGGGRLYYYVAYDPKRLELFGLSIFDVSRAPYRLNGHTYAAHATSLNEAGLWRADNGWAQRFPDGEPSTRESFQTRQLSLSPPSDFRSARVDPDVMSFGELRAYISKLGAGGFSVAEQKVSLQKKLAYPLVTLVVTLLGIPFAVMTGRRGALYGVGLAVALAISYHLLSAVFQAAGTAAVLPAALAAWAANITFLAGALYLTFTVRT
jgi:LPS export ABC transporter permease LptG